MSKSESLSVGDVTPENVWNYAQNKPSLVCRDLERYGVPLQTTAKILLARGVAKWLGVRSKLILLKNLWKGEIRELYGNVPKKGTPEYWYWRGRKEALEECRKQVRQLCHSERWQWPENDWRFELYLKGEKNQNG